jgi:hypothetical protein
MEMKRAAAGSPRLLHLADCAAYYLSNERHERWRSLLTKGKGLDKLSVFEFFDETRRASLANFVELESSSAMRVKLSPVNSLAAVGLYWDSKRTAWEVAGAVEEIVEWLAPRRLDCWLKVTGTSQSIVTTHEGDYLFMSAKA